MDYNPIITVGRQYGSGGREVARKLAEIMNVSFYDKELLAEASKESGICQEVMENYDEKQEKRSFFSMMGGFQGRNDPAGMYLEMPLNHRIFLAQFDTIRKLADKGSCVIVGRCADYVLRDHENVLNVFIKASQEERIKRIGTDYGADPMKAEPHPKNQPHLPNPLRRRQRKADRRHPMKASLRMLRKTRSERLPISAWEHRQPPFILW